MSLLTNPWFNVGMGLMANSGPSLTPVNPWRGIGQGLMAANEAKAAEAEQQWQQMQHEQMQRQWQEAEDKRRQIEQMAANETDPVLAQMAQVAPDEYVKRKLAAPASQASIATAGELGIQGYPPDTPVQVKMQGGQVTDYKVLGQGQGALPGDIQGYNLAKEQGYQGSFMDYQRDTAEMGRVQRDYSLPISTPDGMYWADTRNKSVTPMLDSAGNPIMKATDSPVLQGDIARERGAGTAQGTAQGTAEASISAAQISADRVHSLIQGLKKDPGLDAAVGGFRGLVPPIPGTKQADFINKLDQATNNAFMEARTALKGAGQITDFEGKKAESAIARMNRATSKEEFMNALDDFDSAITTGMKKLEATAGRPSADGWSIKLKGE